MPRISLIRLPAEILYQIFQYLDQEDFVYSFFELNDYFSLCIKYFLGKQFHLTKMKNNQIFQYCLSNVLPSIGFDLRSLSIGSPYCLSTYIESLKNYCPNLDLLHIYCCSEKDDIRVYVSHFIHQQLMSLTFLLDEKVVGKQISDRLLQKSTDEQFARNLSASSLTLHLSSFNDLILLKRYSESDYLADGFYMIECISTGQWLTDSKDDLCVMSTKVHRECIFLIRQLEKNSSCLEYELYNEQTQHRLTVLTYYAEEERWISSSILSTHRKESIHSCSTFTFEKFDYQNQYYIRPCYSQAKRLQVSGKRIIVSICNNENALDHRFKLHRIS